MRSIRRALEFGECWVPFLIGPDEVRAACAEAGGDAWVANDNAPGQVVVSGTHDGLERATEALTALIDAPESGAASASPTFRFFSSRRPAR